MLRHFSFLILGILFSNFGYAQQYHNPLSAFGFGEFLDNTQTAVSSTGWNRATFNDLYHINLSNPASYAYLQSTTFEIGLYAKRNNFINNSGNYKSWQGNINSISLAFPMFSPYNEILERKERKFKWGMGFGISPFSKMEYNYQLNYEDPQFGNYSQTHSGKGGFYELNWNNGISYKNYVLGVGVNYLFGRSTRQSLLYFTDLIKENAYNFDYQNETFLNGLNLNISGQYNLVLNPKTNGKNTETERIKKIVLGAYYKPGFQVRAKETSALYSTAPVTSITDTIFQNSDIVTKGKFYSEYGAGAQYAFGYKYKLNVNYSAQQFDNATLLNFKEIYKNSSTVSIGGEYCPDATSYVSFFKRVKYRAGFRTGTQPLVLDGKQTTITSGIIGLGLPVFVNRQISFVNIGFELGQHIYGKGYKEKYFNISASFNINDDYWFLKRKFD